MIYGIISEFNPFHNGHKWLIDRVKSEHNAVIAVMSSSFVQRGDVSIISKADKTKAALINGIDLVIELPAVYSLSNAEGFAKTATDIIKATGITNSLVFGSECGNVDLLNRAITALDNARVQDKIKEYMGKGEYYPRAVYNSVKEFYSEEITIIYEGANNILGIEYMKAIKGSNITPVTFKRKGSGHDSINPTENIASGSYIRNNYSDKELYTPDYPITATANIENIDKLFTYRLLSMSGTELKKYYDIEEGIENRILSCAGNNNSFIELCESIKTKRYTMARIRRILCCALLGITKEIKEIPVPYIRVLGFTDKGRELLTEMKAKATLPIITNVKDGYDRLDDKGKKIMDIELLATEIWNLARDYNSEKENKLKNDFQQQIINVNYLKK